MKFEQRKCQRMLSRVLQESLGEKWVWCGGMHWGSGNWLRDKLMLQVDGNTGEVREFMGQGRASFGREQMRMYLCLLCCFANFLDKRPQ